MQSVRQLSYQDIRVFNHLLVLWDSNKYLVSPIGPVNVRVYMLSLSGQPDIYCWPFQAPEGLSLEKFFSIPVTGPDRD